jgi:hypothetical protein
LPGAGGWLTVGDVRIAALIVAALLLLPAAADAKKRKLHPLKPTWIWKVTVDAQPVGTAGLFDSAAGSYHAELTGRLKYSSFDRLQTTQSRVRGVIDGATFDYSYGAHQCIAGGDPVACAGDQSGYDVAVTANASGSLIKPVPIQGQIYLHGNHWKTGLAVHRVNEHAWQEVRVDEAHSTGQADVWRQCLNEDRASRVHEASLSYDNGAFHRQVEDTRCPEQKPDSPPPACPPDSTECGPPVTYPIVRDDAPSGDTYAEVLDLVDAMNPQIASKCAHRSEWLEAMMCGTFQKGGTVTGHRDEALATPKGLECPWPLVNGSDDNPTAAGYSCRGINNGIWGPALVPALSRPAWEGTITADWTFKVTG